MGPGKLCLHKACNGAAMSIIDHYQYPGPERKHFFFLVFLLSKLEGRDI